MFVVVAFVMVFVAVLVVFVVVLSGVWCVVCGWRWRRRFVAFGGVCGGGVSWRCVWCYSLIKGVPVDQTVLLKTFRWDYWDPPGACRNISRAVLATERVHTGRMSQAACREFVLLHLCVHACRSVCCAAATAAAMQPGCCCCYCSSFRRRCC